MYYYVIYDLNDNIIAYIDNIQELLNFVPVRKNNLIRKFKHSNVYFYQDSDTYKKIYRFEV